MDHDAAAKARFEQLWKDHHAALYAFARRRLDDEQAAGEVVSEAFLVAWRRLEHVPDQPRPWLFGVARKLIANQLRGERRRRALEIKLVATERGSRTPIPADADELADAALAALARLKPADQEVLALTVWEELRPREAATVLGISAARFSVRLHRAKQRLRKEMGRSGQLPSDDQNAEADLRAKASSPDVGVETR